MVELLMAMLMLSIGILALVGVFAAGTLSLRAAAATSNGTTVADKAMEVYRGLSNCAIYLTSTTIPISGSSNYSQYYADSSAYANVGTYSGSNTKWVTEATTGAGYTPIPASSSSCLSSPVPSPDPRNAVQTVTGPDGLNYLVFTYIVIVTPTGVTSGYVKQVTVEVFNPKNTSQRLATETSLFDPNAAA